MRRNFDPCRRLIRPFGRPVALRLHRRLGQIGLGRSPIVAHPIHPIVGRPAVGFPMKTRHPRQPKPGSHRENSRRRPLRFSSDQPTVARHPHLEEEAAAVRRRRGRSSRSRRRAFRIRQACRSPSAFPLPSRSHQAMRDRAKVLLPNGTRSTANLSPPCLGRARIARTRPRNRGSAEGRRRRTEWEGKALGVGSNRIRNLW